MEEAVRNQEADVLVRECRQVGRLRGEGGLPERQGSVIRNN